MSNEEKILAVLEEHTKRFDSIDKKLEYHDEDIKSIKHSTSNINNSITNINKKLDTHDEDIKSIKHSTSNINKKLDTHDEDIKAMKSSIINIEMQVTKKIPALFDAITVNMNKHEIYDDAISSLNAKTFNNKIRIEALEDSLKNLSVSA